MNEKIIEKVMDSIHRQGLVEIEVSARHVHLSIGDLKTLFGNIELEEVRPLSQPGQFLSKQKVNIIGPKRSIERVSVLGPVRSQTQVEISKSDAIQLGVDAPLRESGDLKGSAGITIVGPCGKIELKEGVIIAQNHIHVTEPDSKLLDLHDKDIVSVKVLSERPVTFENVVIRVSKNFSCKMHVDFDEANAAFISGFTLGKIIKKDKN